MSLVPNNLKSSSDTNLFFETELRDRVTLNDRFDGLLQFNKLIKTIRIVNNDGLNIAQVRTKSPSNPLQDIPILSSITINGWTSFIQVLSDVVTGDWQIEMDLVDPEEARSRKLNSVIKSNMDMISRFG